MERALIIFLKMPVFTKKKDSRLSSLEMRIMEREAAESMQR
jgi:hypothetical protein